MTDMMVGLVLILMILLVYYFLASQSAIDSATRVSRTEQAAVVTRGLILEQIQDQVDDPRIEFDENTGIIRFSDNVLNFDTSEYDIPATAEPILEKMADALAETLPCLSFLDSQSEPDCDWLSIQFAEQDWFDRDLGSLESFRPPGAAPRIWIDGVFIEGHTDCNPFRAQDPDFGNWVLGAQRAGKTYLFVSKHNDQLEKIFSKNPMNPDTALDAHRVLGVASFADRRPARDFSSASYPPDPRLSPNFDSECAQLDALERSNPNDFKQQNRRNRRIDIRIVLGWTAQRE